VEPVFTLILSDFASRLCILRNERHLANKLQPLNYFIGAIALLRFVSLLPQLLFTSDMEQVNVLTKTEGLTHYALPGESTLAYNLVDGICVAYSIILLTFLTVWLKTRMLCFLWLAKLAMLIAIAIYSVQSAIMSDTLLLLNIIVLYMYLNLQSLLYDVEDSREKLDRFFSYNFLFFDDD
jgi:hypothetical protein